MTMVTIAEAAPPGAPRQPVSWGGPRRSSLWRMGLAGRLAMAGAAVLVLWSAIGLGLS